VKFMMKTKVSKKDLEATKKTRRNSEIHAAGFEACRVEFVVPLRQKIATLEATLERVQGYADSCMISEGEMDVGDFAARLQEILHPVSGDT